MTEQGYEVGPGSFAENVTTRGLDLLAIPIGAKVRLGEVLLEITQKGKECHDGCAVYKEIGACIARTEAIFGRVLRGGTVRAGDPVEVLEEGSE
jgi:MOSC domain-containing protein YiiM